MNVMLGKHIADTPQTFSKNSGCYRNPHPVEYSQILDFVSNHLKQDTCSKGYAVEIKEIYSFHDLPKEAKEKAIQNYQDINIENTDWYQPIIEAWTEKLNLLGFEDVEIKFSGFCSQSDGASFTANICVEKFLTTHKMRTRYRKTLHASKINMVKIEIARNCSNVVHEHSIAFNSEYYGESEKACDEIDEAGEEMLKIARQYSKQIYANLYREFEYLTSDESIIEAFEANEWLFTSDGKIF